MQHRSNSATLVYCKENQPKGTAISCNGQMKNKLQFPTFMHNGKLKFVLKFLEHTKKSITGTEAYF